MCMWLKQSTSVTIKFGPGLDSTNGVTPETGLATAMDNASTGIRVSKNGENLIDRNDATVPAHDEVGFYDIVLSTTDTDTLGTLRILFSGDTINLPIWQDFMVVPANVWDSMFGADNLDVNTTQVGGQTASAAGTVTFPGTIASTTNITAGTIATATNVTTISANGIAVGSFATDSITAGAIAANAIGASELATDAIGDAQIATGAIAATAFAAGAIDNAAFNVTETLTANPASGGIAAASFAAGAIDAAAINTDAVTKIRSVVSGTTTSGATSTTLIDTARTEIDDTWNYSWLLITSGTEANRVRLITDFDAATDTITFAPAVSAAVATSVTYEILPAAAVDLQSWLGTESAAVTPNALVAGAVDADVSAMQAGTVTAAAIATDAIDDDAIATGAIASTAFAAGAIDAAAIAANAIGASELATDAIGDAQIATGAIAATAFAAGAIDNAAMSIDGSELTAIPWNASWDTEVESEVNDALDTVISELGVAQPATTPTIRTALMLLYMALRNQTIVQTSGTDALEIHNNAGTKICSKALTDDGSDYTEAKMISG